MPKRATGLTALAVRSAAPGIHVDGAGLMLVVKATGSATWMLRYQLAGKRRDMGLGSARGPKAVSLADARLRAAAARQDLASGADPLALKAASVAKVPTPTLAVRTFQDVADLYIAAHESGWRNAKHRAQWATTLRTYAGPHFGASNVSDVATRDVEMALRPLWETKPETATRLRGRIEAVLDYATVQGWRDGANPARWRGHLDKLFPRRSKVRAVKHHAALPWQQLPAFVAELRDRPGTAARALELLILTAARSGEILGMRWSEVDRAAGVWTVPAARMKAGREHRVPLTPTSVAILDGMARLGAERADLVFPGQRTGSALSVMAMTMALRRMKRGDITPHGFRSAFRDWVGEATAHPREVAESALAHRTGDKVEQAYARGDLFAKRRALMDDWCDYYSTAVNV